mmetsp:Transcript_51363/g.104524  ORF Transcript_51363/g.104524 Transcript_51363/m.104524 type:complete len:340 (-) Transcript_51363:13-1032(-)
MATVCAVAAAKSSAREERRTPLLRSFATRRHSSATCVAPLPDVMAATLSVWSTFTATTSPSSFNSKYMPFPLKRCAASTLHPPGPLPRIAGFARNMHASGKLPISLPLYANAHATRYLGLRGGSWLLSCANHHPRALCGFCGCRTASRSIAIVSRTPGPALCPALPNQSPECLHPPASRFSHEQSVMKRQSSSNIMSVRSSTRNSPMPPRSSVGFQLTPTSSVRAWSSSACACVGACVGVRCACGGMSCERESASLRQSEVEEKEGMTGGMPLRTTLSDSSLVNSTTAVLPSRPPPPPRGGSAASVSSRASSSLPRSLWRALETAASRAWPTRLSSTVV